MLLPKLYPEEKEGENAGVDDGAFEIWSELLLLLSPYSSSYVADDIGVGREGGYGVQGGKIRCCRNW